MVRGLTGDTGSTGRSPHTRGDGPHQSCYERGHQQFSPHAWGWSVEPQVHRALLEVLPTRVGMVRGQSVTGPEGSSSPHTRGDGPAIRVQQAPRGRFSPHAWGWSGSVLLCAAGHNVLPTRVGMVRAPLGAGLPSGSSPHTRGDGPPYCQILNSTLSFSPHAWGWSDAFVDAPAHSKVLPTRVGMVRGNKDGLPNAPSSPHTRGDGPRTPFAGCLCVWFSPHAWGWSAPSQHQRIDQRVLPTRVGMVRGQSIIGPSGLSSPHTRGDGPWDCRRKWTFGRFSPHAWGWSWTFGSHGPNRAVLPTRVGMVRIYRINGPIWRGSPHTRGDGPACASFANRLQPFSPHAWGWSGASVEYNGRYKVLPTRVGMVRGDAKQILASIGSPHTRGDGPALKHMPPNWQAFSPHAWGWSAHARVNQLNREVLPTRVGMVRLVCLRSDNQDSSPHTRGDGPLHAGATNCGR